MQARHAISDSDWVQIEPLLPRYGPAATKRRFVDAILFVGKTGIPWRDLPQVNQGTSEPEKPALLRQRSAALLGA